MCFQELISVWICGPWCTSGSPLLAALCGSCLIAACSTQEHPLSNRSRLSLESSYSWDLRTPLVPRASPPAPGQPGPEPPSLRLSPGKDPGGQVHVSLLPEFACTCCAHTNTSQPRSDSPQGLGHTGQGLGTGFDFRPLSSLPLPGCWAWHTVSPPATDPKLPPDSIHPPCLPALTCCLQDPHSVTRSSLSRKKSHVAPAVAL